MLILQCLCFKIKMKYLLARVALFSMSLVTDVRVLDVTADYCLSCVRACKHGAICYKKSYWLQVKIYLSKMKSFRPPFTASDPMKVYNIILRGFDQIDVPRHVSRWPAALSLSAPSLLFFSFQDCCHSHEAILQRESSRENWLPKRRRVGYQETPMVSSKFTMGASWPGNNCPSGAKSWNWGNIRPVSSQPCQLFLSLSGVYWARLGRLTISSH